MESESNTLLMRDGRGYHTVSIKNGDSEYRVGSLLYTGRGLLVTVMFIMIGATGFYFTTALVGTLLPVEMEKLGSSNALIALFITTIPYILNMVITPFVSFRSDRLRTAWGRRIPYILWSAPFVALSMVLIGWTPTLCRAAGLPQNLALVVLAMVLIGFQVSYLIVASVIYYLFPDVIPEKFIGRFMAFFSLIGSAVNFVFPRYMLPFGEQYVHWLFTGIALFYLVTIVFMCRTVREGKYPEDTSGQTFSLVGMVRSYFRECYSIPFYYGFFIMMALSDVSVVCRTMFNFLYAQKNLGLSYAEFGTVTSWGGLVGVILSFPVGWLVDKFHALQVYAAGLILVIGVNAVSFFWVRDYASFYISTLLLAVVYTIQNTATLPCFVAILPKAYYGQFSSANALLRAVFMAACGAGGGILFDWLKNYQYIYAWDFLFTTGALISFAVLFRNWKKRGGPDHYCAPLPAK